MERAVVLSSGGVDSTTCIGIAVDRFTAENVSTVSAFYGQKHRRELEAAAKVADFYGLPHYEIDLSAIFKYSNCPLLSHSTQAIVHKSYAQQIAENGEGMVMTYVPFRNGLILSAVTALAVSLYPGDDIHIYIGAHADDAAGNAYADCSKAFTDSLGEAIHIGTYGKVKLEAPFVGMSKSQVVKEGLRLGVPYELTWSCYEGGERPCGSCGTCIDRAAAFAANGVKDPALEVE